MLTATIDPTPPPPPFPGPSSGDHQRGCDPLTPVTWANGQIHPNAKQIIDRLITTGQLQPITTGGRGAEATPHYSPPPLPTPTTLFTGRAMVINPSRNKPPVISINRRRWRRYPIAVHQFKSAIPRRLYDTSTTRLRHIQVESTHAIYRPLNRNWNPIAIR